MNVISKLFKMPLLVICTIFTFHSSMATANAETGAESFISDLGHRAIQSLTDGSIDTTFLQLLDEGFDVDYIAGFVMRRHWSAFTNDQKKEFESIFRRRLKNTYAIRFKDYKGVNFNVKGSRPDGKRTLVQTTIQKPGGPLTNVDWVVVKSGSGYKIQDVSVEGLSMGLTMASDYSASYQREGSSPETFLKHLKSLQ
jgi:phospholipid transport system substrate-binding protein